jgi:uncharacterized membrane protein YeaQ/YmgE (transglycosylase-associated protein family)
MALFKGGQLGLEIPFQIMIAASVSSALCAAYHSRGVRLRAALRRGPLHCRGNCGYNAPIVSATADRRRLLCCNCHTKQLTHSQKGHVPMINFLLWLIFGALVGWLASMVMKTNAQQGTLTNIVVGVVGAFIGGLLFNAAGLSGTNINDNTFSLNSLVVSFIGAVILLGAVNMAQRGRAR